jgi:hypothetical protein
VVFADFRAVRYRYPAPRHLQAAERECDLVVPLTKADSKSVLPFSICPCDWLPCRRVPIGNANGCIRDDLAVVIDQPACDGDHNAAGGLILLHDLR